MADVVIWGASLQHISLESDCPNQNSKRKIRVSTSVPAARMEADRILWVI